MAKLFVYGSLKRGGPGEHIMAQTEAMLLGRAHTLNPSYEIHEIDWYPGLTVGEYFINGELWSVDDGILSYLDAYEGTMFERKEIPIVLGTNGNIHNAWVYMFNKRDLPPKRGVVTVHDTQEWRQ